MIAPLLIRPRQNHAGCLIRHLAALGAICGGESDRRAYGCLSGPDLRQRIVSTLRRTRGGNAVSCCHAETADDGLRVATRSSGILKSLISDDLQNKKWRRRGSNPKIDTNQVVTEKQVTTSEKSASAHSQQTGDSTWLDLATVDISLLQIISIWPSLNKKQRNRIMAVAIQK